MELESINKNINLYYSNLNKNLNDVFNKELKKIFNKECNIKFDFIDNNVKLNFKFNKAEFTNEYSKEIENNKNQLEEKKQYILLDEKAKIKSDYDLCNNKLKVLDYELKMIENEYYSSKKKLGNRPLPIQKYKKVEKTKGIWFLKKTYYDIQPDGLDYTECERWDYKTRNIENNLKFGQDRIYKEISKIDKKKLDIKIKINKIETLEKEILELEDNIKFLEHQAKLSIERNKEVYIERKKEEIYVWIKKYVEKNVEKLLYNIKNIIENKNHTIKKIVEEESIKYLDNYKVNIEKDLDIIKESLKDNKVINENLFNLISDLRNDLVRMR